MFSQVTKIERGKLTKVNDEVGFGNKTPSNFSKKNKKIYLQTENTIHLLTEMYFCKSISSFVEVYSLLNKHSEN